MHIRHLMLTEILHLIPNCYDNATGTYINENLFSVFPMPVKTITTTYDPLNNNASIVKEMDYTGYDIYGNITDAVERGISGTGSDDIYIHINYDTTYAASYIVSKPVKSYGNGWNQDNSIKTQKCKI